MSTEVRWRRGTAAQNNAFTGALAEVTVDTTNGDLRVHDGSSAGGVEGKGILARAKDYADNLPAASAASTAALAAMPVSLGFVQMRALGREGPFRVSLISELTASEVAARALDTTSAIFVSSTADTDYVWVRVYEKVLANWFGVLPWNADNADALDAFHSYVSMQGVKGDPSSGEYLAGRYLFGRPLANILGQYWQIKGPGRHACEFVYNGANTAAELITIGADPLTEFEHPRSGMSWGGVRIQSTTQMTAGAALHIRYIWHIRLNDVGVGSEIQDVQAPIEQDNLWDGIILNRCAQISIMDFTLRMQHDGITCFGGPSPANSGDALYLDKGNIWFGRVGLYFRGGFGGAATGALHIYGCKVGIAVDRSFVDIDHKQFFFSQDTWIDSCNSPAIVDGGLTYGTGLIVNDGGGTNQTIVSSLWIGTCSHIGVDIRGWGGTFNISGGNVVACGTACIVYQDAACILRIDPATNLESAPWGILAQVATTNILCDTKPILMSSGRYNTAAGIESEPGANPGFRRYADGRLHQWGEIAAGSSTDKNVTYPITFSDVQSVTATPVSSFAIAANQMESIALINRTTSGFTALPRLNNAGTIVVSNCGVQWEAWGR